jgi:lycopene cyclase domain-containing protein
MKEYTIIAFISVLAVIIIDILLKTRLILSRKFWVFWCVMFVLIFAVNGYLTWRPVVIYGEEYFMNIRLFTIPFEDFLYGFSLITINIVLWESITRKFKK